MSQREAKGGGYTVKGDPLKRRLLPRVFGAYGWQPLNVTKIRGVFRVQTSSRETFALKPLKADTHRLNFLERMNRHLQEHNYAHVLPWIKTKYGDSFYIGNGTSFYATPWYGKEWSVDAPISRDSLIQSLAELHRLTENVTANEDGVEVSSFDQIVEHWNKQVAQVQSYADVAKKREFSSPFDVTFLAYVDELNHAASFAINGLKRMAETDAEKPFRRVFCHRRVHRHNLVCHESHWKWIDFEHAGLDVPVRDIAAFVQRFPPQEQEDLETLDEWLNAYETSFPLTLREKQLLCLFLAYPENVMKWLNRYYKRKRSRDEMFYVQGLENALHYFKLLKRFVKQTWPRAESAKKPKTALK